MRDTNSVPWSTRIDYGSQRLRLIRSSTATTSLGFEAEPEVQRRREAPVSVDDHKDRDLVAGGELAVNKVYSLG